DQYDVALMNPPYGEMPEACKDYCKGNRRKGISAHYPYTGNNLYAAFMERCIELVQENCLVGMLTSQTFMNLSTFRKTRTEVLNKQAPPEVLCDTGFDVLDGAKVVTAATVLRKERNPDPDHPCICIRMFQENEEQKESVIVRAVESLQTGGSHPRIFPTSLGVFRTLPGAVYGYWVPTNIVELFNIHPPLDKDLAGRPDAIKVANVKSGPTTGDDDRFVRFFWEVDPCSIAGKESPSRRQAWWCPFARGS